jgi:hypothetical protein
MPTSTTPANASSRYFQRLDCTFDVASLRAALARQPALFGQHGQRGGQGSPHQAMTDIWVRFNAIERLGPGFTDEHDSVWYPAYADLPELAPVLFGLMAEVQGERLGGVLITKLPPGGVIAPHVDGGWHANYYEKFYVAVDNPPGALFRFPDGDIEAANGECHWFDNSVPHGVVNHGDTERIALIVCIRTALYAHPGGKIR